MRQNLKIEIIFFYLFKRKTFHWNALSFAEVINEIYENNNLQEIFNVYIYLHFLHFEIDIENLIDNNFFVKNLLYKILNNSIKKIITLDVPDYVPWFHTKNLVSLESEIFDIISEEIEIQLKSIFQNEILKQLNHPSKYKKKKTYKKT